MSRCPPISRQIYHPDCKIIVFKVEEQVLSNFQKICLFFLVGGSFFYDNKLN